MAKLLIVDDEAKIREVVKEYAMLMHEYEVEEAENVLSKLNSKIIKQLGASHINNKSKICDIAWSCNA